MHKNTIDLLSLTKWKYEDRINNNKYLLPANDKKSAINIKLTLFKLPTEELFYKQGILVSAILDR